MNSSRGASLAAGDGPAAVGRGHDRRSEFERRVHRLLPLLALEHLEHAVGDHEPAHDVDRGGGDRDEAQTRC